MTEILKAVLVLFVLLGSSALGRVVYPLLSERHRSREVIDFVRLVIARIAAPPEHFTSAHASRPTLPTKCWRLFKPIRY